MEVFMTESKPYLELYDRVNKTTKNRFAAQRRLEHHNKAVLWTITLSSIFLLITPLAQGFGLTLTQDETLIDFVQILLTVVILAVSIILSTANFAVRGERIHNCGMELNGLARRIYPKITSTSEDAEYKDINKEYDEILRRYENHTKVDFMRTKLDMSQYYQPPFWYRPVFFLRYLSEFWLYIIILLAGASWVAVLFGVV
ncbi:SLATT domain-containing protein [Pseudoalteromonas sp. Hal099]|tara:strand:+ start:1260 stop:1859 length:600 start_codon:yes stop_codon:yes gene_type:complete